MNPISDFAHSVRHQVDDALENFFVRNENRVPGLVEAMQYTLLNGGKRVRPMLVFAAAETCGPPNHGVLACACAIEMIHAYSLVHDDLPAMDNDDLRRGKPTLHIAFDEATAILAGDALQTAAFELLSRADFDSADQALACVAELAEASGFRGMAGGQYIDLSAVGLQLEQAELENMHSLKTGALISASARMGALAAGMSSQDSRFAELSTYGQCIGLAFQIKDDLLDATGDTEIMGKRSGTDARLAKPNFVSLLGVEGAEAALKDASARARAAADSFGSRGQRLVQLVSFITDRSL